MLLKDKKIGFALTGSFCTFEKTIPQISKLIEEGAEILPIMSFNSYKINSRFGESREFIRKIEEITNKKKIYSDRTNYRSSCNSRNYRNFNQ